MCIERRLTRNTLNEKKIIVCTEYEHRTHKKESLFKSIQQRRRRWRLPKRRLRRQTKLNVWYVFFNAFFWSNSKIIFFRLKKLFFSSVLCMYFASINCLSYKIQNATSTVQQRKKCTIFHGFSIIFFCRKFPIWLILCLPILFLVNNSKTVSLNIFVDFSFFASYMQNCVNCVVVALSPCFSWIERKKNLFFFFFGPSTKQRCARSKTLYTYVWYCSKSLSLELRSPYIHFYGLYALLSVVRLVQREAYKIGRVRATNAYSIAQKQTANQIT